MPHSQTNAEVRRRPPQIPNYRNITYLTSGGMGSVFRAIQCGFERVVAILAVLNLPSLFTGETVPKDLRFPEELPDYWHDATTALDASIRRGVTIP